MKNSVKNNNLTVKRYLCTRFAFDFERFEIYRNKLSKKKYDFYKF